MTSSRMGSMRARNARTVSGADVLESISDASSPGPQSIGCDELKCHARSRPGCSRRNFSYEKTIKSSPATIGSAKRRAPPICPASTWA